MLGEGRGGREAKEEWWGGQGEGAREGIKERGRVWEMTEGEKERNGVREDKKEGDGWMGRRGRGESQVARLEPVSAASEESFPLSRRPVAARPRSRRLPSSS